MIDVEKLTKLYYSIGDVANMFSVNDSTLRFWESEFTQLKPKKNRKGDRRYTKKDILVIDKIYTLLKLKGFTLKGAKEELKREIKSENQKILIVKKLKKIKKGLENIKSELS